MSNRQRLALWLVERWRWLVLAGLFACLVMWVVTHVTPAHFGECTEIPVRFGKTPTIRECEPFGTTDFAIPVGILIVFLLLGSGEGDGDLEVSIPWLGTFKRTQRGREAVNLLKEEEDDLDRRGEEFLETLPSRSDSDDPAE